MKEGLRNALRQMFFIGMILAVVLFFVDTNGHIGIWRDAIFPSVVIGLLCAAPLWFIYRLLRFMFWKRTY